MPADQPHDLSRLPRADLRPSFLYDCPICGQENLVRVVEHDAGSHMAQGWAANWQDKYGEELPEETEWASIPQCVQCKACHVYLATWLPYDEDDTDDDDVTVYE